LTRQEVVEQISLFLVRGLGLRLQD
jgi:hypothetical protein